MKRQLSYTLIAFLMSGAIAPAMVNDHDKYSARADREAEQLAQEIQSEIATLGEHPWAGAYYYGDGRGVNVSLMLAPESGYLFTWRGCLGLYDRNYGPVSYANTTLSLTFTYPNERNGFQGIAEELLLVTWGERTYLIPSDDVIGFCNAVNSRLEPRDRAHGRYFLKRGDDKRDISGLPGIPSRYRQYLLPDPVEAVIIEIGSSTTRPSRADWHFKDTRVIIDKGAHDGLLAGMKLYVIDPSFHAETITLIGVEENSSEGMMTQIGETRNPPEVGWTLSTVPGWRQ